MGCTFHNHPARTFQGKVGSEQGCVFPPCHVVPEAWILRVFYEGWAL